ncbi:uncharacterized protein C8Q71DRAFT_753581 [Rhodofomes roseus]|uniref:Uncharacterized protein n=2 Tax=Rhodofomes roseus TaxID=34475 RepID=A0ABQ8KII2_9APHY|nr:uncharacterized protein C8Q71DRAFT_753581 [Rhodofomes roseus]KAH9837612.1 hypothetical protein C8Q71DRAFT_753581 [Rhodofomes roseus]
MPSNIYKGDDSLWAKSQMSANEFTTFRNLVEYSAKQYLDVTKYSSSQDEEMLQVHITEVTREWAHEGWFEDDWIIIEYTRIWLHLQVHSDKKQNNARVHRKEHRDHRKLTLPTEHCENQPTRATVTSPWTKERPAGYPSSTSCSRRALYVEPQLARDTAQ